MYDYDRRVARLPGGSSWMGASDGEKWTEVRSKTGDWVLRVLPKDGKFELRLKDPKKVEYRWNSAFRKQADAMKEAELVAKSIKKRDGVSLAGWKKV